jgi:hypothetical protein
MKVFKMSKLKTFANKFLAFEKKVNDKFSTFLEKKMQIVKEKYYKEREMTKELEEKIRKETLLRLSKIVILIFLLLCTFFYLVIGVFK